MCKVVSGDRLEEQQRSPHTTTFQVDPSPPPPYTESPPPHAIAGRMVIFDALLSAFALLALHGHLPPSRCHDRVAPPNGVAFFVSRTATTPGGRTPGTAAASTTTVRRSAASDDNDLEVVPTATGAGTSPSLVGRPVERARYLRLLEWLQSDAVGAEISDKVEIRSSSQGDGCGAFVSRTVERDELLFTVPRGACLTLADVTADADCGEAFARLMAKAGPGGNTVVMAGYMAKEYLLYLEERRLGEDDSAGTVGAIGGSRWGPYFETLPWERGVNNQEHCLFWEDERVETLLDGSLCYREATALREEVDLAIRVLDGIVSKPIRLARNEMTTSGFQWPWEAASKGSNIDVKGPPEGLADAIKGAFVCLLTRSFQDSSDGEGDEEKLVPLLDMLQHSETPNVRHAMRTSDGTVEVRARCDIEAGSELWNQYRSEEEESMPYARFFTRFGFVPNVNEPIENLLRDKSSIFYPQTAEV